MRSSSRRAVAGAAAALGAILLLPALALGAEPTATPAPGAGDPRSPGEGPGLVGDPLFAIGVVVAIGIATLLVSLAYVRLTAARHD